MGSRGSAALCISVPFHFNREGACMDKIKSTDPRVQACVHAHTHGHVHAHTHAYVYTRTHSIFTHIITQIPADMLQSQLLVASMGEHELCRLKAHMQLYQVRVPV